MDLDTKGGLKDKMYEHGARLWRYVRVAYQCTSFRIHPSSGAEEQDDQSEIGGSRVDRAHLDEGRLARTAITDWVSWRSKVNERCECTRGSRREKDKWIATSMNNKG